MGDRAADRAPVADLRIADRRRHVVQEWVSLADDLRLVDLPMRGTCPDAQVVVRLDDAVEPGDVAQVDEQGRLPESKLDERDEAVAPGQELGLAFAIREDLQRLVQVARTDVIELGGDHRAAFLLPVRAGTVGPSGPDGRRTGGDGGRRSGHGDDTWRDRGGRVRVDADRGSGSWGVSWLSIRPASFARQRVRFRERIGFGAPARPVARPANSARCPPTERKARYPAGSRPLRGVPHRHPCTDRLAGSPSRDDPAVNLAPDDAGRALLAESRARGTEPLVPRVKPPRSAPPSRGPF